jgi:hypothetical protein
MEFKLGKVSAIVMALTFVIGLVGIVIAHDVTVTSSVEKTVFSFTVNYTTVNFGTQFPGTTNIHPTPDYTTGVYNATFITNFPYRVKVMGTDFSDGAGHTFSISNLKFDTNNTASNLNPVTPLSNTFQVIDTYPETVTATFHGFLLSIPANQFAASYSAIVTIIYENL